MALRWLEGFDTATNETLLARLYESLTGTIGGANPYDGRSSGNSQSARSTSAVLRTKPLVGAVQNTWIIGFAVRADSTTGLGPSGGTGAGFRLRNTDGEQLRLEFVDYAPANPKPGGSYYKLRVLRGATELARTNEAFLVDAQENAWVYFEFKATIDNAAGTFALRYKTRRNPGSGFVTATWDNSTSGIDTQNQTSTGVDRIEISWDTGSIQREPVYDDIYVFDSTGSVFNDFIGGVIIEDQNVAGTGATNQWVLAGGAASVEDAWNESPETVDNDKRVTSEVPNDITLATVAAKVYVQSNVVGIRLDHHARMESATGSFTLHFRYRKTTGTPAETDGGNYVLSGNNDQAFSDVQEQDPNTASAWAAADLNSYQYGVRNGG